MTAKTAAFLVLFGVLAVAPGVRGNKKFVRESGAIGRVLADQWYRSPDIEALRPGEDWRHRLTQPVGSSGCRWLISTTSGLVLPEAGASRVSELSISGRRLLLPPTMLHMDVAQHGAAGNARALGAMDAKIYPKEAWSYTSTKGICPGGICRGTIEPAPSGRDPFFSASSLFDRSFHSTEKHPYFWLKLWPDRASEVPGALRSACDVADNHSIKVHFPPGVGTGGDAFAFLRGPDERVPVAVFETLWRGALQLLAGVASGAADKSLVNIVGTHGQTLTLELELNRPRL